MTAVDTPSAPRAGRLLGVTVAVALGIVGLPWIAAGLTAHLATVPPRPVPAGVSVGVPDAGRPAIRIVAPAGWSEDAVGPGAGGALVYARGADTISVYATTDARDVGVYASRLRRLVAARDGVVAVPDGGASAADGLAGPRFRVTDPTGRTGEMVVLARGTTAAAVVTLAAPGDPVDLRPLLASMRVAS